MWTLKRHSLRTHRSQGQSNTSFNWFAGVKLYAFWGQLNQSLQEQSTSDVAPIVGI